MAKSKIEWTETTWNPTTGCSKVSRGCQNCYAESMTRRLQAMGVPKYREGFDKIVVHPTTLSDPYGWKKPTLVFVNSMSDLFHEEVTTSFIEDVFAVMANCSRHTFQVLTKRAEKLAELSSKLNWSENIWMGVTIEDNKVIDRLDFLRTTEAKTKFLSLEPLLGPLPNLDLKGIDWVIVGGESGPKAREMKAEWASDIKDHCFSCGVPFFFKQWGGVDKKKNGRVLENRTWDQMPEAVAI